jgi:phospholipid transport system substrate-binding protein
MEMTRSVVNLVLLSCSVSLCSWLYADDDALICSNPVEAISGVVDEVQVALKTVCGKEGVTKQDIEDVILETFVPTIDVALITKQVLGRQFWTKASDEQKARLEGLLKQLLARQYAEAFNCSYLGSEVEFFPVRGEVKRYTRVESSLKLNEKSNLLLRYALRCEDERWQVYDIVIDGLSLSQTYRSQFNRILQQGGIDVLNDYLDRKMNKEEDDLQS